MDGMNRTLLYQNTSSSTYIWGLAIDHFNNVLYWTNAYTLESINLDGSNRKTVAALNFGRANDVIFYEGSLYFSVIYSGIYSVNLSNASQITTHTASVDFCDYTYGVQIIDALLQIQSKEIA